MRPKSEAHKRKDRTEWMKKRSKHGRNWYWKSDCPYGCCVKAYKEDEFILKLPIMKKKTLWEEMK